MGIKVYNKCRINNCKCHKDAYTRENNAVMELNSKACKQITDPLKDNINLMGDIYWSKLR